jgi:hypothetical protein
MYSAASNHSSIVAAKRVSIKPVLRTADSLEQSEVLHVAGADLQTSATAATSGTRADP